MNKLKRHLHLENKCMNCYWHNDQSYYCSNKKLVDKCITFEELGTEKFAYYVHERCEELNGWQGRMKIEDIERVRKGKRRV